MTILMLWEAGHHLSTFNLAKELENAGHEVTYLSIPALSELVRSYGFTQLSFLPDIFSQTASPTQRPAGRRGRVARRRRVMKAIASGDLTREIAASRPDIVLLDQLFAESIGVVLQRHGTPILLINTSLPNEWDRNLAPLTSDARPCHSIWSRLHVRALWSVVFLRRWWGYMTGTDLSVIRPALRRSSPELVLCASELDFPRPHRLNQHYIGPSVALERPPQPFPFDRVPAGCPLIYCSLGTQAYRYKRGRALLKRVVSAAARMSHLYFVVVADPSFGQYLKVIPQNVLAVSTAPQLPLLRRASVAITHGGLGTIKECILCGVPILVVPQAFDQKGNAARVEYHGLGRHAGSLPSVRRIHALLRELLLGRSYRSNMQSMRRVFERQQAASSGVSWVLHYLALARSHRAVE